MGSVRLALSLMTVMAQVNSSHAVRKLNMLTDAIAGLASGNMMRKNTVNTLPPSAYAASSNSRGMLSM